MEVDIKKPENASKKAALIKRHIDSSHNTTTSTSHSSLDTSVSNVKTPDLEALPAHYSEPLSDDEDDDEPQGKAAHVAKNEGFAIGLPEDALGAAAEAKAFREAQQAKASTLQPSSATAQAEAKPRAAVDPFPKLTEHNLKTLLADKYGQRRNSEQEVAIDNATGEPGDPNASNVSLRVPEYVSDFRAPSGKLVSVPIRIEPKVYFANGAFLYDSLYFQLMICFRANVLGVLQRYGCLVAH